MKYIVPFLLVVLGAGCGSYKNNPYEGAMSCPGGVACFKLCQSWSDAQPAGTTRYAGLAYCSGGTTLYALYERYGEFVQVNPGSYSTAATGAPCAFTVTAACGFTEN